MCFLCGLPESRGDSVHPEALAEYNKLRQGQAEREKSFQSLLQDASVSL